MNTRITYLYRDASNYKQIESIVVEGELTFSEVEPYLDEKVYFIPGQIGLEDLQHRFSRGISEDDHPWHELKEGDFEPTIDPPTASVTALDLLEQFHVVHWNVKDAEEALGIVSISEISDERD